jgi:FkbM family methyltransferase
MISNLIGTLRFEGLNGVYRRAALRLRLPGAIPSYYGPRFCANHGDKTFRSYVKGSYGDFYSRRLSSIDKPFVFLDIGSNQGLYAILAAFNEFNVNTYAFEPVPRTFALLEANIRLNKVGTKCTAINAGIAEHAGTSEMSFSDAHSGSATLVPDRTRKGDGSRKCVQVRLISACEISEIVAADKYDVFVKIDVEGFESSVISEVLASNFADRISEIFFEANESWMDIFSLKKKLYDAGFVSFTKVGGGTHYDILAARP